MEATIQFDDLTWADLTNYKHDMETDFVVLFEEQTFLLTGQTLLRYS